MDRTRTVLRWGTALVVLVVAGVVVSVALDRSGTDVPDPIEVAAGTDATAPDGGLRQVEPDRVVALGVEQRSADAPALVAPDAAEPGSGSAVPAAGAAVPGASGGDEVLAPTGELLGPVPTIAALPVPDPTVPAPLLDPGVEVPLLGPATPTTTALPPLPSLLDPLPVP